MLRFTVRFHRIAQFRLKIQVQSQLIMFGLYCKAQLSIP